MSRRRGRRLRGFTLVEVVVFISIVGIAVAGVLVAYDHATAGSADAVVKKQALAVAESLLEEIQQMPFTYCDPDDPAMATATSPAACAAPETAMAPEAGETRYSATTPFDNVNDYNGYDTGTEMPAGIKDIGGTPVTGLAQYNASVIVAPAPLPGVPAGDALLISVTVAGPSNVSVTIDGYRTRHAPRL